MKKPYTKNKKKTKNDEWEKSGLNCTMPVKSVRLKKESQLDRIERKLDELLKQQPTINITQPGTWTMPWPCPTIAPEQPTRTHVGTNGDPTIYYSSNGGSR